MDSLAVVQLSLKDQMSDQGQVNGQRLPCLIGCANQTRDVRDPKLCLSASQGKTYVPYKLRMNAKHRSISRSVQVRSLYENIVNSVWYNLVHNIVSCNTCYRSFGVYRSMVTLVCLCDPRSDQSQIKKSNFKDQNVLTMSCPVPSPDS